MARIVFTARLEDTVTEDGGCAKWAQLDDGEGDGLFVRIHSWSDDKQHPQFDSLIGRIVRVTIETDE